MIGLGFVPQAVERILELSQLRPYLIQKLCIHAVNRMLEEGRTTIQVRDVEGAWELASGAEGSGSRPCVVR